MSQGIEERQGSSASDATAPEVLSERVSIVLRPIGAPMSLGFFGLAAPTFVLAGLQLGWVDPAESKRVAVVLLAFAFPAQAVAGIFSFLARDGVAATAMSTLALVWLVTGLTLWTSAPGSTSDALGLFLVFAALAMTLNASTAAFGKLVPATVFLVAAIRFLLTGVYELSSSEAWEDASGVVGLGLFVLAVYAAAAAALEDARGRTVLPLGRRGKGKTAVHGSLLEQVEGVSTEPGVRIQL